MNNYFVAKKFFAFFFLVGSFFVPYMVEAAGIGRVFRRAIFTHAHNAFSYAHRFLGSKSNVRQIPPMVHRLGGVGLAGLSSAAFWENYSNAIGHQEGTELVVWFRKWGGDEKEFGNVIYYLTHLMSQIRQSGKNPILLIATKPGDRLLTLKPEDIGVDAGNVQVFTPNMDLFSDGLNTLIQHTPSGRPVLSISYGIRTSPLDKARPSNPLDGFSAFLQEGFSRLKENVWSYGWQIDYGDFDRPREFAACHRELDKCYSWGLDTNKNNGKRWGRASYNTALMYAPAFIEELKRNGGVPDIVDTKKGGMLTIVMGGRGGSVQEVPMGGGEENPMRFGAMHANPQVCFVHKIGDRDTLYIGEETGTGTDHAGKMLRKDLSAWYYGLHFGVTEEEAMQHMVIEGDDNEEPAGRRLSEGEPEKPAKPSSSWFSVFGSSR